MSWMNILSIFYPVGAIYFSTVNTSPASVVGGTWSQLTGGMLGLTGSAGVAAAGSNGGSRKISVDQMPSHTHVFGRRKNGGSFESYLEWFFTNMGLGDSWLGLTGGGGVPAWGTPEIASTGGAGLHPRPYCCFCLETYSLKAVNADGLD